MKVVIVGDQLLDYSILYAALEPRIGALIRGARSCRATEMHTETATVPQSLSTSDAEAARSPRTEELVESGDSQVQEVVKAAGEDLRQLLRKRDEIVKQIRTIKQTI